MNTHESVTPLYLNINIAFESVFVKTIFVSFHTFSLLSLLFALFAVIQRSADFCTCRHFLFRYHQGKVSVCIFCAEDHSFINIFYGEDVSEKEAQKALKLFTECCPNAEITLLSGGQPVYYYMISAE